jgi:hypothetical protein
MMLTQGESNEEQGEKREDKERRMKTKRMMMMMMTQKRDMKVLRILSHENLDGGQRRTSWTRILTRTRR